MNKLSIKTSKNGLKKNENKNALRHIVKCCNYQNGGKEYITRAFIY